MPISIKPMNNFSVIVLNDTRLKTKYVFILIVLDKPYLRYFVRTKSNVHCTQYSTFNGANKKGYNSCVF